MHVLSVRENTRAVDIELCLAVLVTWSDHLNEPFKLNTSTRSMNWLFNRC